MFANFQTAFPKINRLKYFNTKIFANERFNIKLRYLVGDYSKLIYLISCKLCLSEVKTFYYVKCGSEGKILHFLHRHK